MILVQIVVASYVVKDLPNFLTRFSGPSTGTVNSLDGVLSIVLILTQTKLSSLTMKCDNL